ncbi:hypothetical protein ACQY0O_007658 [Thecaphora frezii]
MSWAAGLAERLENELEEGADADDQGEKKKEGEFKASKDARLRGSGAKLVLIFGRQVVCHSFLRQGVFGVDDALPRLPDDGATGDPAILEDRKDPPLPLPLIGP